MGVPPLEGLAYLRCPLPAFHAKSSVSREALTDSPWIGVFLHKHQVQHKTGTQSMLKHLWQVHTSSRVELTIAWVGMRLACLG